MITRIEIDGFKTFKDFSVDLALFQVIVGPNGSGKSNLFDALHFLSRLADTDLRTAFQEVRGEAGELFTKFPDGTSADRMKFAVEMLVDRKIQDDLGREFELKYTRLRYELEIVLHKEKYELDELYIIHESLQAIPRKVDNWSRKHIPGLQNDWLPADTDLESPFFSFTYKYPEKHAVLETHYLPLDMSEEDQIHIIDAVDSFESKPLKRTILSSNTVARSHHAIAAHEEMLSWQFLHLNPEELRKPGSTTALPFLTYEGKNLATTLARIQAEDSFAFHLISLDMGNLVPDILKIKVEQDKTSDKYVIIAETSDRRSFPSRLLSDGTLRLLALATLRNDPQFHGLLCLEEPENGVDPSHIKSMARLLREVATDFSDLEQADEPLRQVLITTHSPTFISQPDVFNSLLFAHTVSRVVPHKYSMEITLMVPVITPTNQLSSATREEVDKSEENYTIDQVQKYLDRSTFEEAQSQLEQARAGLNEG